MRIPIREQLAGLVLLSSGIGLAVIAIATWYTNHNFVLELRSTRLSLTASLKSAQLVSLLDLMQNSAQFVSSRVLIQYALMRYNEYGNNTDENWTAAAADLEAAIGGGSDGSGQALLLQAKIFPSNANGPAGNSSLLNVTGTNIDTITLPYLAPNGSAVILGEPVYGYPPAMYPNFTYLTVNDEAEANYDGDILGAPNGTLVLGPYHINTSFSLISYTLPIINNTSANDVLGWLTVVCDARLVGDVVNSVNGLGNTGQTLLVGPANSTNEFTYGVMYDTPGGSTANPADVYAQYLWPLSNVSVSRHPEDAGLLYPTPFALSKYSAVQEAFMVDLNTLNNAGANVDTTDEAGKHLSVGWAVLDTELVDWAILIEQSQSEVWQPIVHLRIVLLACVFGTLGAMLLLALPLAHFASAPIRRLREATTRSVVPAGFSETNDSRQSLYDDDGSPGFDGINDDESEVVMARKEGFFANVRSWSEKRHNNVQRKANKEELRRRQFRIPGKVKDRNHCVQDELSDLTRTFNAMSDELMMQYERLEERVAKRTAELELSKKAAEAANESKTLFIANISHELKTPLNGILGMCAVCMQEDDPVKLKRSLGIIYKSGDLLLNLLTDLLTFSKNQVGQQLALDEKEFRLSEISSQVLAIFDKQATEGQISLRVNFEGTDTVNGMNLPGDVKEYGPAGTGRVKDMIVWGDQHRILQVVINLVSNSLKFTPSGGSVVLTIRCVGENHDLGSRKGSFNSKATKQVSSRHKNSDASLALPVNKMAGSTAIEINPLSERNMMAHMMQSERPGTPPPGRSLVFEFECKDTGPGIAENLQQRIFEPFVQGDLGLTKKFGGTGLGLSICSQLAGLMRGTVGVESELGHGATFTMQIPLRHLTSRCDSTASSIVADPHQDPSSKAFGDDESRKSFHSNHSSRDPSPSVGNTKDPAYPHDSQPRLIGLSQPFFASNQPMESPGSQVAAMERIASDAGHSGKIRVLVAEDNKVNQEVVLRMLKLEDIYDVTIAKDGQEALDLVKESMNNPKHLGYNLIFMDVQMPNLDGLQSTRMIRDLGYQAPIVALTAFSEESNVRDCLDSGMNYFLSKPIRRPALKKVLKEYCAPILEEEETEADPMDKARPTATSAGTSAPKRVPSPLPKGVSSPSKSHFPVAARSESPVTVAVNGQNTFIVKQHSRPNSLDLPPRSPARRPE